MWVCIDLLITLFCSFACLNLTLKRKFALQICENKMDQIYCLYFSSMQQKCEEYLFFFLLFPQWTHFMILDHLPVFIKYLQSSFIIVFNTLKLQELFSYFVKQNIYCLCTCARVLFLAFNMYNKLLKPKI